MTGHQHALAHLGSMDILVFTDPSLLFLSEFLYENWNCVAMGHQRYFIIAEVFYQSWRFEWIYLFWTMLLVLEENCSGRPSHTVAAGAASLVSSRHCLHTLESRANTH